MRGNTKSILIFVILFIFLFGKTILINIAFFTGIEKYIPESFGYKYEKIYNMLIRESFSKEDTKKLVHTLAENPIHGKESETYELLGDVSLLIISETGSAITFYEKSLRETYTPRVKKKYDILFHRSGSSYSSMNTSEPSQLEDTLSSGSYVFTGFSEILSAKSRVQNDSKNRSMYISFLPEEKTILYDVIDFLDTNTERIDW